MAGIPFDEISRAALGDSIRLLSRWLPDGRTDGDEYIARNPTRSDKKPGSFKINTRTGKWSDFAAGAGGADLIDLYAYLYGTDLKTAALELGQFLGVIQAPEGPKRERAPEPPANTDPPPQGPQKAEWRPVLPVPHDAPRTIPKHGRLGAPSAKWIYRDGAGQVLGLVCRFNLPDGGKETLPLTFCECTTAGFSAIGAGGAGKGREWKLGERQWRWHGWEDPRPLYGLDRLAARPDATVIMGEGEKTVDALGRLLPACVAVGWPGGSKALGKVDLGPLKGRKVVYVPDADQPGADAAWGHWHERKRGDAVFYEFKPGLHQYIGTGCKLVIVDPPEGKANGWDFADGEAEGWTPDQTKEWMARAVRAAIARGPAVPPDPSAPAEQMEAPFDAPGDSVPLGAGAEANYAGKDFISQINAKHAVTLVGSRALIMSETVNQWGNPTVKFMAVDAFRAIYANQHQIIGSDNAPVAKLWLAHPLRRTYPEGVCFAPQGAPPGYFNLWRGYAVTPNKTGDFSIFLDHMRTNVADGNEADFNWIMGFFADIIQRPQRKPGTSLVLRGKQGSGKSIVGEVMGVLLGVHHTKITQAKHLTGSFNAHMEACLLLQADEGFWAGDHAAEGVLKDLVTGERQLIERKGIDAVAFTNLLRLLVTSNNDWVVPAGFEERRFAVFDVKDYAMQNTDYFGAMIAQLEAGGYGALLNYLQEFDLTKVNIRKIPDTAALGDQKVFSLSPEQRWWREILMRGYWREDKAWTSDNECTQLWINYIKFCEHIGVRNRLPDSQLGKKLREMCPALARTRIPLGNGARPYHYIFPTLEECRAAFDELIGITPKWEDDAQ